MNILELCNISKKRELFNGILLNPDTNKINNLKTILITLDLLDTAIAEKHPAENSIEFIGFLINFSLEYFLMDETFPDVLLQDSSVINVLLEEAITENLDRKELVLVTSLNSLIGLGRLFKKMNSENNLLPSEELDLTISAVIITSLIMLKSLDINLDNLINKLYESDIPKLNIINFSDLLTSESFNHLSI